MPFSGISHLGLAYCYSAGECIANLAKKALSPGKRGYRKSEVLVRDFSGYATYRPPGVGGVDSMSCIAWASGGNCMRRKFGCLSLAGFVTSLAIGAIPVDAGIRPSFSLDGSSWSATHIVLVQTTPTDGVFSVVESWKGDLKAEDSLEISELKPNKDAVPISSFPKPQGFGSQDTQGISEQIPRQPAGSRMILFLKKRHSLSDSEWHRDALGIPQYVGRNEGFGHMD